ncbi:MAG: hypothetical protein ABJD24_14055 [Acidimicrobiales bacterium]
MIDDGTNFTSTMTAPSTTELDEPDSSSTKRPLRKVFASETVVLALVAILTVLLVGGLRSLLKLFPDPSIAVVVDVTVPDNGVATVFMNTEGKIQSRALPVYAGRNSLRFEGFEGPLRIIQIDPIDKADQEIRVHSVTLLSRRGKELLKVSGNGFKTWASYNSTNVVVDADGYASRSATQVPALATGINVNAPAWRPAIVGSALRWLAQPWPGLTILLGLPGCALLAALAARRRFALIPLLIAPIAVLGASWLAGSTRGTTKAAEAFGQAGYEGRDASYGPRFLFIGSALTLVLTALTLALRRQMPRVRGMRRRLMDPPGEATGVPDDTIVPEEERVWRRRLRRLLASRAFATVIIPLLFAVITLPSAKNIAAQRIAPLPVGSWDSANLLTWDHFFARGLLPMKDFWYPYGNLIVFSAGLLGALLQWVATALALVAVASALWHISRRSAAVIVGMAAVAVVELSFGSGFRYIYPVAIVAWFAVTRRHAGYERWLALAAIALSPWLALDLGVYTIVGASAAVVIDELAIRGLGGPRLRSRLVPELFALVVGWLGFFAFLAASGRLGPTLSFVFDQQSTTAYVAYVTPVETFLHRTPTVLLFVAPFGFLAVALYAAARERGRALGETWIPLLAGLGAIGVLVLAKQVIRPGVESVLAFVCISAVAAVLAASRTRLGSVATSIVGGVLVAALVLETQAGGSLSRWRSELGRAPSKLGELVDAMTSKRAGTAWLKPELDPRKLKLYVDELAAVPAIEQIAPNRRLFVLSGSQFLYPLTEQPPYWTISTWDTSPLAEQRRLIKRLEQSPPAVVAIDRRDIAMDAVPHVLRIPLAYQWVVSRYRLDRSVGPYDLLIPRVASDPIDWNEWRAALGVNLDLGRLPAAANSHHRSCPSDHSRPCVDYLNIAVAPVSEATPRIVHISGVAGAFTLSLDQVPGDKELSVPLGRFWFWTSGSTVSFDTHDWVRRSKMVSVVDGDFLY